MPPIAAPTFIGVKLYLAIASAREIFEKKGKKSRRKKEIHSSEDCNSISLFPERDDTRSKTL